MEKICFAEVRESRTKKPRPKPGLLVLANRKILDQNVTLQLLM